MRICTKVINMEKKDNFFSIMTDGAEVRIWFVTDDVIRIRAGFDSDFAEESYSLVTTAWEDRMDPLMRDYRRRIETAKASCCERSDSIVLQGEKLKVVVEKDVFSIKIFDEEGTLLHSDIPDLAYMEDSNKRRIHTSEIDADDCFYGFGEKSGDINKNHKFMSMSPKDAMGYNPKETDSLYKHIPFYIKLNRNSKKASGYFYHNTYECDFDMGRERSNYWKPHSRYRTDGGDIDLFFIAGPEIKKVVERYTGLTGKPALLPRYALGYLGSSMYYPELEADCDEAVLEFIDTTKKEGIPIDNFQLSSGYTGQQTEEGMKRCVFTWNLKRFQNPKKFFARMREKGVSVSPNVKPGILLVHPGLEEMKKEGIFVRNSDGDGFGIGTWWGGKGMLVDFTNPFARRMWKKMLKEQVLEMGTSTVWNDNCEYDSLVDKDCICDFEGKKGTIGQLKSVMANLMCHITWEGIRETHGNTRPFIICRSGHCGIQRYGETWAGDNLTSWDSLKYNIATILGMGLSGVAMQGCDIGGFYGPAPEPELFVRWIQNGIFQPRFSIHSVNIDNTVTEPWMYSEYTDHIRRLIRFRYSLVPYYYSLMKRASETGLPVMEPMFSVFQEDESCYDEGVDFMVGDFLLVANVVEKGAASRQVYLPKNETFYDFYTRDRYEGGRSVTVSVDIETIPLFLRGGAILPMALNQTDNLSTQWETGLHLLCADDQDGEFVLYEDDGASFDYLKGDYLKTFIRMKTGVHTTLDFKCEGSYLSKIEEIYVDVIHRESSPYRVWVDGKELPHYLYRPKFEKEEFGWYYSQSLKSVQIKYPNPKKDYMVKISYEAFDMIGM